MQLIKLTESVDRYVAGQVISVDENSAEKLIAKGKAEAVTDTPAKVESAPVAAALPRSARKADLVEYAVTQGWTAGDAETLTKDELADQLGLE